jgi:superoxide dismutase, Fe-Mn family
VKALVYRAIVSNPVFSVPQLCDWTGLDRNQVYPHLAELKEKGILKTESLRNDKMPSPAFRPLTLYRLTEDAELRVALATQIAPFLQTLSTEHSLGSENLERAHGKLDEVEKELEKCEQRIAASTTEQDLAIAETLLRALEVEMGRAKDDVELAWYESGSKESPLRSKLQPELQRVQADFERLRHLEHTREVKRSEIESAKLFSEILTSSLHQLSWREPESALASFKQYFRKAYERALSLSPLQEMLSFTATQAMSSLALADRDRDRDWISRFYCVLTESSVRFGSDPELSFALIQRIREAAAAADPITEENFANLCFLTGRTGEAFEEWLRQLGTVRAQSERIFAAYPFTLILQHKYGEITGNILGDLQVRFGLDGAVSAISREVLKNSPITTHILHPALADWLEPGTALPLSGPLKAQQPNLYAYGPLQDLMRAPGLPALRVATGLVGVGAKPEEAWAFAGSLLSTSAMLLLHLREPKFEVAKRIAESQGWSEIGIYSLNQVAGQVRENQAVLSPAEPVYPTSAAGTARFELPSLPYDYAALEPVIDKQTMTLHHDMHHGAYVKNLNAALEKHPELRQKSTEELLRGLNAIPEDIRGAVRNHGGGHLNHTMLWRIMKPKGGGDPTGPIAEVIHKTFGNFKDFQARFSDAGLKQFGSGWVWLAGKANGEVQIITTPNQDNPISQGLYPIFGNDLWEHAYYLKYNNRRPEYLAAWWNVINWEEINHRYGTFKSGKSVAREAAVAYR